MTTLRQLLRRIYDNLLILQEREASAGGNPPLELLNAIEDHETAISLIEEALPQPLTEAGLLQLKQSLRPLLLAANIEQVNLDALELETPRLPFEPETILIPAGPFMMGSDAGEPHEAPPHEVALPRYRLGRGPVTVAQYAEFIRQVPGQTAPRKAGWYAGQPPADKLAHPVVSVSWDDAVAYCGWLSRQTGRTYRLPTEAEWEKAAGWAKERPRLYPWGDEFDPARCNSAASNLDDTTPVGQFSPQGDSFLGGVDMAGNVQEWTSTLWGADLSAPDFVYPYSPHDGRENAESSRRLGRVYYVYRGGSFRDEARRVRCSARGRSDPDSKIRWRGFRVVEEI